MSVCVYLSMQHVCIYNVRVYVSATLTERRWSVINKARVTRCRLSNRAVVTHAEGPGVQRAAPELFITVMRPGGGASMYCMCTLNMYYAVYM